MKHPTVPSPVPRRTTGDRNHPSRPSILATPERYFSTTKSVFQSLLTRAHHEQSAGCRNPIGESIKTRHRPSRYKPRGCPVCGNCPFRRPGAIVNVKTFDNIMTTRNERRDNARNAVNKPVKIRCLSSGRYYSGRTSNLSAGGALVELAQPHRFLPGERLKLGISWNRRQTVLDSHTLIDAIVTRGIGLGDRPQVAVRFENRQELAATG